MAALYLTESDVARLIDMPAALGIVEECLRRLALGEATNVPRDRAMGPGIILHTMSAAAGYLGHVGWKAYTTTKQGARFLVGLCDSTGAMVALVEADKLGQLRTGAATGVAAKYLSAPDADRLGVFGTGTQARTQLTAIAAARKLAKVLVYGRDLDRRRRFAAEMSQVCGVDVEAVDDPKDAVRELPIVVTATTSRTPVFDGRDLSPGTLVCAVGSNWLNKAEVDVTTIARAARVVCDDVAACRHEAGDFVPALEAGVLSWDRAVSLGEVITGRVAATAGSQEIILFKSVGLAVEDVAMAVEIVGRARRSGLGVELPF